MESRVQFDTSMLNKVFNYLPELMEYRLINKEANKVITQMKEERKN